MNPHKLLDGKEITWWPTPRGHCMRIDGIYFLHVKGPFDDIEVDALVDAFRQGMHEGEQLGRCRLQNEFRNLMDWQK